MTKKQNYLCPKAEHIVFRSEGSLLTGSETRGASTEGFTTIGSFTDSDWAID